MVTRAALLFLSRRRWLRRWTEHSPLVASAVRRFVAGQTLEDAIAVAKSLATEGTLSTLDYLGENVTSLDQAEASLATSRRALDRLHAEGLDHATVSIQLTQFGLDLSESECHRLVSTLVGAARQTDRRVEIDMESTAYTDRTLALVRGLQARYGNLRAVIQAYLYRSEADIEELNQKSISVRLCKGAYLEPSEVAFPEKLQVCVRSSGLAHFAHLIWPTWTVDILSPGRLAFLCRPGGSGAWRRPNGDAV